VCGSVVDTEAEIAREEGIGEWRNAIPNAISADDEDDDDTSIFHLSYRHWFGLGFRIFLGPARFSSNVAQKKDGKWYVSQ